MNWLNRKEIPLPKEQCKIIIKHSDGELTGMWHPYNPNDYHPDTQPHEGYLGTVVIPIIDPIFLKYWKQKEIPTVGFHAWTQNNSEFIEYKIVTYEN